MSISGPDNIDDFFFFFFFFFFVISSDLDMDGNRIRELKSPLDLNDAVNKRYLNRRIDFKTKDLENKLTTIETKITAFQLDGTKPMTSDLDMGNNRITNVAHPRNPEHDAEYENDVVTAKILYDYVKIADKKVLKSNEDNVLDGKLNMQQHKIVDLADPVDSYDAVNQRYVSYRIQALVDENTEIRSRKNRLENVHQH